MTKETSKSAEDYNLPDGPRGYVRVDLVEYERQRARAEAEAEREARRQRELDPFGYGHWGKGLKP